MGNSAQFRIIDAEQARDQLLRGEMEAAQRWARTLDDATDLDTFEREVEALVLARIELARNRPDIAIRLMDRVLHRAEQAGHVHSSIGALTLRSIAHDQNHDRMAAVADLNAGLELGRVGGYRRVFLDEGPTIVPLLRQRGPHGVSLANVLAPPGEVAVVRLSSREQEVLRLLDRGLSNREIAEQLVVTREHDQNPPA